MASIGNTVTSVPFIADSFSGNASTTSFSPLTRAPAGTASIAVFISGVYQAPGTYTLSGTTITFASAPASGVGNIIVLHLGNGSATQVPSDGSVTTIKLSNDTYGYINAAFTSANAAFATANTGTASGSYANSAFATANTGTAAGSYANSAFASANLISGVNTTQNTNITNAGTYANTGFAVANSAALYANSAFSKANNVVTSAVAGTGVSVSAATGAVTFTNSGVTSLVAGSGVSISGATGAVTVSATGGGTVTSVATGNGLSGGTITSSGTLIIACPSFNSVGSYAFVGGIVGINQTVTWTAGSNYSAGGGNSQIVSAANGTYGYGNANNLSGTWKWMSSGYTQSAGSENAVAVYGIACRVS